jgi:hypothetical protein
MPKRGEQAVFGATPKALCLVSSNPGSGDLRRNFLAEPGDWIWIQL